MPDVTSFPPSVALPTRDIAQTGALLIETPQITDSGTAGRAVVQAETQAQGRLAIGAAAAADLVASSIANAPAGNIAAATVQAALNELDGEKIAGPASATDGHFLQFDGTTGKLAKGGLAFDADAALAANSATRVPAQSAVRGYAVAKAGDTMTGLLGFSGTTHAGLRLNNLTTAERDAIASPQAGFAIWNTTAGRLQLYSGTGWTAGMVRLDGDTMTGALVVNTSGLTLPDPPAGPSYPARIAGLPGTSTLLIDGQAGPGSVITRRTNGTFAAPTGLVMNDILGSFNSIGYAATGYASGSRAFFRYRAAENWTDTAQGTYFEMLLTPTGSVAPTLRLAVQANGDTTPGADNSQQLGTPALKWSNVNAVLGTFTGAVTTDTSAARVTAYRTGTSAEVVNAKVAFDAAAYVTLTDAATITWDHANGWNFKVTLAGNRTLGAPSNTKQGASGSILVRQDATGGRTLAFSAGSVYANGTPPTIDTVANRLTILFWQALDDGTIFYSSAPGVR